MSTTRVHVQGLEGLRRKLKPELLAGPMRGFFRRATGIIERRARQKAPVYTGKLRASIGSGIDRDRVPMSAWVGSGRYQGWFMEKGTGIYNKGPFSRGDYHLAAGPPLDAWAKSHGFESGWHAARAIKKRRGIRPKPFLGPALRESMADIKQFVLKLGRDIAANFGR